MTKHDGRALAKKFAFRDMRDDDIAICKYDNWAEFNIHVVLTDEQVIGKNLDRQINKLINIYQN